jgi:hypothetical protein
LFVLFAFAEYWAGQGHEEKRRRGRRRTEGEKRGDQNGKLSPNSFLKASNSRFETEFFKILN